MTYKMNALVAAAALAAAGSASAAIDQTTASSAGNSSLLFLAIDRSDQIALTIDLGLNMINFIPGSALLTAGTTIDWNFNTNTVTGDATVVGTNSWNTQFASFASVQSGGDYRWAVVAADSIQGSPQNVVSPTNVIFARGFMATGNPTQQQMLNASTSGPTGNALGVMNNFYAGSNFSVNGNHTAPGIANGANVETSGPVYGAMTDASGNGTIAGQLTWDSLSLNGVVSRFQYQQQSVANPIVYQLGSTSTIDSLTSDPATFRFDINTGVLSYAVAPIPEPGTYALMLAGLAGIGFIARRRKA